MFNNLLEYKYTVLKTKILFCFLDFLNYVNKYWKTKKRIIYDSL